MNFNELQQIIRHLKKTVSCSECNKKYIHEDFEILSTFQDQALLFLNCFHCKNQLLVHVTIMDKKDGKGKGKKGDKNQHSNHAPLSEKDLQIFRSKGKHVTTNEIIDLHVFLNQFNGDFKELFEKSKK